MDDKRKELLKGLPKIDEIIGLLEKNDIYRQASREMVREACRDVVQKLRDKILTAADRQLPALSADAATAARSVEGIIAGLHRYKLRRLVNATGVILHTNLGRAPCAPKPSTGFWKWDAATPTWSLTWSRAFAVCVTIT